MKKMVKTLSLLLLMLSWNAVADNVADNTVMGTWQTIDDETGKPKSVVEIYELEGKLYGKIASLFPKPGLDPDPICTKCTDDRKDKKIIGMVIISELEKDGDEWAGGTILDPSNGKTYRCKIWLEEDQLKVRGYVGFFFRTQTWHKLLTEELTTDKGRK